MPKFPFGAIFSLVFVSIRRRFHPVFLFHHPIEFAMLLHHSAFSFEQFFEDFSSFYQNCNQIRARFRIKGL